MSRRIRNWVVLVACAAPVVFGASTPEAQTRPKIGTYPITAVPMERVTVTGGFWAPKLETNRTVTIPAIFDQNEQTGRVDNFRKGAGLMPGDYSGRRFNDTDIYKAIEAASLSLISHPDPALSAKVDALIALIAKNQQADGYLMPARTINPQRPAAGLGLERWMHENTGSHETYNSGHLIEAAIAHARATGQKTLLDIATKNADLLVRVFGPAARVDAPGHEIVEMALVRLYTLTGDRRYFDLAKFFLDTRGTNHTASRDYTEASWQLYNDRPYRQDDRPLVDQRIGEGHAVRGAYVYSAMADMAGMLKDPAYDRAIDAIWQDVYAKRAYLTGGLGSVGGTEAFGEAYQLPNRTAYTETCASVGAILWNHRMFLKSGDTKYLDAFEQTLYNGLLSGVSVKGDTFFYQNPLEATAGNGRRGGGAGDTSMNAAAGARRSPYFDVACCPANLARLVAQMPGLIYATRGDDVFINLYVESAVDLTVAGAKVHLTQTTNYPWDGRVTVTASADRPVSIRVFARQPGWAGGAPFATDLYRFEDAAATRGGMWRTLTLTTAPRGVTTTFEWPMPVRRVVANAALTEDAGKVAIMRGPVVYAFEGVDNGGAVLDLQLPPAATFTPAFRADLLGGVTALTATVGGRTVTAVPYFAWANRGRGEMVVWVKRP